jgi:heme O synthase-like polyprenyltransferase
MQVKFLHHTMNSNRKPVSLPKKLFRIFLALLVVSLVLLLAAVLIIYIAIGATIVFGYLWWKTRGIRKQMRNAQAQQSAQAAQDGLVIEGEVVGHTNHQA